MQRKRKPSYNRLMMNGVATSRTPTMQVIEHDNRKYVCKRIENKWIVKGSYPASMPVAVGVIQ